MPSEQRCALADKLLAVKPTAEPVTPLSFLEGDVEEWPQFAAYQASAVNLQELNVVNACAE